MICIVCGKSVRKFDQMDIIGDDLSDKWKLTTKERFLFDQRETTFCPYCRSSLRDRILAEAIIKTPKPEANLIEWVKNNQNLKVAEINSCGSLHKYFKRLSCLSYSEFKSKDLLRNLYNKYILRVRCENIMDLNYPDNYFDLVLHSETLEHVSDPVKALGECQRVLKKGGCCIFTIPVIKRRTTKYVCDNNSYHGNRNSKDYLVFWEFGGDFLSRNKIRYAAGDEKRLCSSYLIKK
ncbi:MAG TPA: class I SAM-dependent methyltransferase [Patescibacteria group bacterium]|nr:class I SAM-dependent methyltransferase [Patescibacteria group bacterium]